MKNIKLKKGDIVQLNPFTCKNPMSRGCFMVITEPKPWGAQGYVQSLGENDEIGGQAHYRVGFEDMELTGGKAVFELE